MSGTVLVIDDDKVNLDLLQIVLERAGHPVVLANNGQKALELLAERRFDLVMMDIQMPGMDGMTVTRYIRQCEHGIISGPAEYQALLGRLSKRLKGSYTPVIAITARVTADDRARCFEAGMDDYITKPFRPEVMFAVFQRVRKPLGTPPGNDSSCRAEKGQAIGQGVIDKDLVRKNLQKLYQLNPGEIEVTLAECIETLRAEMARGKEAFSLGDLQLLGRVAHKMKGTFLSMGLDHQVDLIREIEDRQVAIDPVMEDRFRQLCKAIAPLLDESS